jgi:Protein of unknown function (DUF3303)
MLFHVTWKFIDTSEAGQKRSLSVFEKWQPPAGADFQGFYGFADGTGGVAIVEADSAATLTRHSRQGMVTSSTMSVGSDLSPKLALASARDVPSRDGAGNLTF